MRAALVFLVGFLAASAAFAQPAGLEKVLFPVIIHPLSQVPGAFGTSWVTDVSVLNAGAVPVQLSGAYVCFLCRTLQPLQPDVTYTLVPVPRPDNVGGAFLFVDSRYVDQLRFGLRVRDVSREADGFGSEVPVVRAREFRDDGVSLLGVPIQPSLRLMLRVYALAGAGDVLVRIYEQRVGLAIHLYDPMPVDTLVAERRYSLLSPPTSSDPSSDFPAYVQTADLPLPSSKLARIDVVPITPGMRIWAFVSATNNTTQQVTVISPH